MLTNGIWQDRSGAGAPTAGKPPHNKNLMLISHRIHTGSTPARAVQVPVTGKSARKDPETGRQLLTKQPSAGVRQRLKG